jgi:transcriptional regulator with XRE-family HTH domain
MTLLSMKCSRVQAREQTNCGLYWKIYTGPLAVETGAHPPSFEPPLRQTELKLSADVMSTAVARILDELRDRGGLQGKDIANIVDVSTATVSRWSKGNATPQLRTQTVIADLRYVVERLSEYYSPEETRLWLHTRHQLLNGERAIDLINNDRTEEVLAVIERLDSGAFL